MKKYGIITKYNGLSGNIKGVDAIDYKFLKEDLLQGEYSVNEENHVEFESQIIEKPEFTFHRANYVRILKKTNEHQK